MSLDHFLPVTYLKNFSADPKAGRKAIVWRFDGKQSLQVEVGKECVRPSHYSKSGDQGMFDTLENWYGNFMSKSHAPKELSLGESNRLLGFILHVHFRGVGVSYQNDTGKENKDAYVGFIAEFGQMLGFPEDLSPDLYQEHLNKVWRTRIVRVTSGELVTSDSPVICYGESGRVDVVILPLTPELCAIGFNQMRFKVISDALSQEDEDRLQRMQLKVCCGNLYTRTRLSADQEKYIREDGELFKKPPGCIDDDTVKLNALVFPKKPFDVFAKVSPKKALQSYQR